jgi:hypothetical protein
MDLPPEYVLHLLPLMAICGIPPSQPPPSSPNEKRSERRSSFNNQMPDGSSDDEFVQGVSTHMLSHELDTPQTTQLLHNYFYVDIMITAKIWWLERGT